MTKINCSVKDEWLKGLFSEGSEGFKNLVEAVVQSILQVEMTEHVGAEPYERIKD